MTGSIAPRLRIRCPEVDSLTEYEAVRPTIVRAVTRRMGTKEVIEDRLIPCADAAAYLDEIEIAVRTLSGVCTVERLIVETPA